MRIHRQKGVAVVTALLLTTLAVTIVASLFWQQQVQVRSIENQRLQAQKKWVTRGVLSFARLGIKLSAATGSSSIANYMGETWAQPIKDFKISDFMAAGYRESNDIDPSLSGQMTDAQAGYNINNLINGGTIDPKQLAILKNLFSILQIDPSLAKTLANYLLNTQAPPLPQSGQTPNQEPTKNPGGNVIPTVQSLRLTQMSDLAAIPGFTPEIARKLTAHLVNLNGTTNVNVNTTTNEVLAAIMGVSVSDAARVRRNRTYFQSIVEFNQDAQQLLQKPDINVLGLDVRTDHFFVNGRVTMEQSSWNISALIKKTGYGQQTTTQVIWAREY